MKIILAFTFVCFFSINFAAQNGYSIQGKVTDENGPIKAAVVTLTDASTKKVRYTTVTDESGEYRFQAAPGKYILEAKKIEIDRIVSLASTKVEIRAGDTQIIDLALETIGLIRETVTVAADTQQPIEQVSKTVNIIDGQQMRERADFTLADTLRTIPGFRVQQLGGFGRLASIKTRGLRNTDTAVLIDGLRFRDAASDKGDATPFLSDITLTSVSRIEVLRGSGSSLYGTNAIGGVVDFQTPEPQPGFHGQVSGAFGGYGLKRFRGNISDGTDDRKFGFNLGISRTVYTRGIDGDDDAHNTNFQGRIVYNPFSRTNISGRVFVGDAFVKLNSSPDAIGMLPVSNTEVVNAVPLSTSELIRFEKGTPISSLNIGNATFIPDANDPDNFQKSQFFAGQIGITQAVNSRVVLNGFYQMLRTSRNYSNGPLGTGDFQPFGGTERSFFIGQIHTAGAIVNWTGIPKNHLKIGYEYEWEKFGNDGLAVIASDHYSLRVIQSSNTFFVQDLVGLFEDKLQLSGAFRAQWFSLQEPSLTATTFPGRFVNPGSPPASYTGDGSISYYFDRTKTKLRAHVGNGYRVPSLFERFSFSRFFGTNFFSGNPLLKPERSIAYDGGIDQAFAKNRIRLSGTYFYTEIKDEIAFLPTDFFNGPAYFNFDKHFSRGVEFSGDIRPTKSTDIFVSYTFTNSDIRNFRRVGFLPPFPTASRDTRSFAIPDHQFTFVATQRFRRFWINADFLATSSYLAPVFQSHFPYNSYIFRFKGALRADLTAGHTFLLNKEKLSLRLFGTIENLFDYDYYENGFRTIGRNGRMGISFNW